ncbi:MAG TPA: type II secretion system F family protein [Patescibacteria group bacterium]
MRFVFKAKDRLGKTKEGSIEAGNSDAAVDLLQKNGLFPLHLKEERGDERIMKKIMSLFEKVSEKELMLFFKQLSILIEAKVPIITALETIKNQSKNIYFQKVLDETIADVQDGLPLSDALKKNDQVFSNLSISIIKAGEVSGNLRKSIDYVASNIEKNYQLASKVKSALMYPAVVLVAFFIIGFIFATVILPRLTAMIESLGVPIPWYTQIVISFSHFMSAYWWAAIIIILGIVGSVLYYLKTDNGRREWDEIKLKMPIIGSIFQKIYIARFSDNLQVLLAGGLPIVRALTLASSVVNNTVYQGLFLRVADEVKIGGSMSEVLRKSKHIPPIVSQIIKIGEESGEIELVLGYVAKFYEQEVDTAAKNLSTLIEPVLMIIIGIAVGALTFMIIMPIYNISGQM